MHDMDTYYMLAHPVYPWPSTRASLLSHTHQSAAPCTSFPPVAARAFSLQTDKPKMWTCPVGMYSCMYVRTYVHTYVHINYIVHRHPQPPTHTTTHTNRHTPPATHTDTHTHWHTHTHSLTHKQRPNLCDDLTTCWPILPTRTPCPSLAHTGSSW